MIRYFTAPPNSWSSSHRHVETGPAASTQHSRGGTMNTTVEVAEIRQLMADREAAMKAGDADRLVSRYVPEVVKYDLAPPLLHAGPEARDANSVRAWLAGFDG